MMTRKRHSGSIGAAMSPIHTYPSAWGGEMPIAVRLFNAPPSHHSACGSRKGDKLEATEAYFRTQSALVGSVLAVLLISTPAMAQADPHQKSTPDQLVDALNSVFGKQTTNRA